MKSMFFQPPTEHPLFYICRLATASRWRRLKFALSDSAGGFYDFSGLRDPCRK
jgi:hypothetical protein